MASSILNDIKKVLGVSEDDTSFDVDIILHINSVFSTVNQMGIGPDEGFVITDSSDDWEDFITDPILLGFLKSYFYLKVRMLFDPPTTSFLLEAFNKQIAEFEGRISFQREWGLNPIDPMTV